MKKVLLRAALVVLVLVLALAALLAVTFLGRRPVKDGEEISDIRIVADGGMSSAALVPLGRNQFALIDAGNDTQATAILAELMRRRLTADAVRIIFLTHGHPDHLGGVLKFPNAEVMALEAEVPLVEGRVGAKGPATRLFPVSPTNIHVGRALKDGDSITIGIATFRVYAMPGHTAGSAAYLVNNVLFVGDSADVTSGGVLQGSPWLFSDSQAQNRASLAALAARLTKEGVAVKAIVPAHSGALQDGLPQLEALAR